MPNNPKEYYTAGELADLFELPKQTLLYYDKTGVLVPEFISSNNYRQYSLKQYLILEVIINMRKLDIPIETIKDYLNNRSEEYLQKILLDKEQDCKKIIQHNQKIINNIATTCAQLQKLKNSHLNQITVNYRQSKRFFISLIDQNCKGNAVIDILAKHNLKVFFQGSF